MRIIEKEEYEKQKKKAIKEIFDADDWKSYPILDIEEFRLWLEELKKRDFEKLKRED